MYSTFAGAQASLASELSRFEAELDSEIQGLERTLSQKQQRRGRGEVLSPATDSLSLSLSLLKHHPTPNLLPLSSSNHDTPRTASESCHCLLSDLDDLLSLIPHDLLPAANTDLIAKNNKDLFSLDHLLITQFATSPCQKLSYIFYLMGLSQPCGRLIRNEPQLRQTLSGADPSPRRIGPRGFLSRVGSGQHLYFV